MVKVIKDLSGFSERANEYIIKICSDAPTIEEQREELRSMQAKQKALNWAIQTYNLRKAALATDSLVLKTVNKAGEDIEGLVFSKEGQVDTRPFMVIADVFVVDKP